MPLRKFKLSSIGNGGISTAKLADGSVTSVKTSLNNLEFGGTEGVKMPVGTTAQRANAQAGDIRFNSTINLMEYYAGTNWKSIDSSPTISSIAYVNGTALATAGGETLEVVGQNFSTTGSVSASIGGSAFGSVTVNSSSSLTLGNSPAKSAGDYDLSVTNPSGLSGAFTVSYSGTPAWNTAADTIIADPVQGSAINVTGVTAAEGSDTIAYSEVTSILTGSGSGKLGLTLNSSTGAITGTVPTVSADTTYTFTIRATDDESQTTDRQFRIKVTTNYFGDGSDGSFGT